MRTIRKRWRRILATEARVKYPPSPLSLLMLPYFFARIVCVFQI
jgi:hypothetical protein